MTVLRSREIVPQLPPKKTTPKRPKTTQNATNINPCTPPKTQEPSPSKHPTPMSSSDSPRRSLRIAGILLDLSAGSGSESRRVRRRTTPNSASISPEERAAEPEIEIVVEESGDSKEKGRMPVEEAYERGKRKMWSYSYGEQVEEEEEEEDEDEEEEEKEEEEGKEEGGRRFSRIEKGKGKVVEDSLEGLDIGGEVEPEEVNTSDDEVLSGPARIFRSVQERRMEYFKGQVQRSAAWFAHFTDKDELYPGLTYADAIHRRGEIGGDVGDGEEEPPALEDWPGPFSTAWKIIEDREKRSGRGKDKAAVGAAVDVEWVPRRREMAGSESSRGSAPSLVELCIKILAENAGSLVSLYHFPEELLRRLSRLLCDSRRMDARLFGLLVQESPMEICLTDCSWCSEEDFVNSLQGFDPSCLRVLKLDQSGRCLPDYVLPDTLARSENFLPVLHTLSLKGACRLSNVGIKALASSAPALRSLNLSQCSLLTHASINTLANYFGPNLRELYLEDCQGLNAMLILPALMKFTQLERLSVAGIETVTDKFICEFVCHLGHSLKELILARCIKLTDQSLKAIARQCPGLCAIDISNCKLTDASLGYLANGCRSIQRLILCRSPFSDKSIAAFMETSGGCLEELSLNNVQKVGYETAISIARGLGKLQKLDLSWCRNVTDNALGHVVDNCLSLKVLKLFGCTQITHVFLNGHSNLGLKIIGKEMTPLLKYL